MGKCRGFRSRIYGSGKQMAMLAARPYDGLTARRALPHAHSPRGRAIRHFACLPRDGRHPRRFAPQIRGQQNPAEEYQQEPAVGRFEKRKTQTA